MRGLGSGSVDPTSVNGSGGGGGGGSNVSRRSSKKGRLVAVKMTPWRVTAAVSTSKSTKREERMSMRVGFVGEVECLKVCVCVWLLDLPYFFLSLFSFLLFRFLSFVGSEGGERGMENFPIQCGYLYSCHFHIRTALACTLIGVSS